MPLFLCLCLCLFLFLLLLLLLFPFLKGTGIVEGTDVWMAPYGETCAWSTTALEGDALLGLGTDRFAKLQEIPKQTCINKHRKGLSSFPIYNGTEEDIQSRTPSFAKFVVDYGAQDLCFVPDEQKKMAKSPGEVSSSNSENGLKSSDPYFQMKDVTLGRSLYPTCVDPNYEHGCYVRTHYDTSIYSHMYYTEFTYAQCLTRVLNPANSGSFTANTKSKDSSLTCESEYLPFGYGTEPFGDKHTFASACDLEVVKQYWVTKFSNPGGTPEDICKPFRYNTTNNCALSDSDKTTCVCECTYVDIAVGYCSSGGTFTKQEFWCTSSVFCGWK